MRFLKELDGGIPDEYMYEGRRVWIDVAVRYGIRDENKRKFSEKKYLFLENLEDEHSRPPRWMPNGQETLDLYYSVKQKFKDIIARKKSLNGDVDIGNETGSEDLEIEEEEEPECEDDDEYRVKQRPWNPTKRISLPPRNRAQTNFYGHSPEKNESTSEKDVAETSSSKKLKRKADIFNIDDVDSGDESLSRDKQAPSSIKRHKIVVPRTTVPVSGFFMHHREQSSSAMSSRNKTSCNSSYTASSTVSRTDVDEANDDLADATQLYEGGNIEQDQKPDWINVENGVEIGVNTDPSPLEDIEEARKEDRREIKDLKKQLAIAWKMVYEEKSQRERIAKLYRKGDDERLQKEFPEMSRD